jgi:predicted kinase
MTARLIITHGLPGAGKDHWALGEARKYGYTIVNRDAIRDELFGKRYHTARPDQKSESKVAAVYDERLREIFRRGGTAISSDTNLNARLLPRLVSLARAYGAAIEQVYFDVPVELCMKRNAKRAAGGGRDVPAEAYAKLVKSGYSDGHIKEFLLGDGVAFAVPMETEGMRAITAFNRRTQERYPLQGNDVLILDLDGTLANNLHAADRAFGNGPGKNFPLMYELTAEAEAHQEVLFLAQLVREAGVNIFVLSGAPDGSAKEIIRFLERVDAPVSRLLLRKNGDGRPDTVFKEEVFRRLSAEGYTVVHAIDDRASVLAMWQRLGVLTSAVAEHTPRFDPTISGYPDQPINTFIGGGFCIRCGLPSPGEVIHDACRS